MILNLFVYLFIYLFFVIFCFFSLDPDALGAAPLL
jgi:hypothetical protein